MNEQFSNGNLLDYSTGATKEYQIILLDEKWKDEIIRIQEGVVAEMLEDYFYEPLTLDEFEDVFSGSGYAFGVLVSDHLAGFRVMTFNDEETIHMAIHLGLPPDKVIFFESTVILKRYQRNKLQCKMMGDALTYIIEHHQFEYAISTVAPQNIPSLKNILRMGFRTVELKYLYGGKSRLICIRSFKDVHEDRENHIEVRMDEQILLQIKHEEGYKGYRLIQRHNEWFLLMSKR